MILSNDKRNAALRLDEKTHVEEPLLQQLEDLGWTVVRLEQQQEPQQSLHAHFGQVVLQPKLEEALRKINPFLRDEQVAEVGGNHLQPTRANHDIIRLPLFPWT